VRHLWLLNKALGKKSTVGKKTMGMFGGLIKTGECFVN